MSDIATLHAETRERLTEIVSGLGEEGALQAVPACPEWTVRDVIAHLAGIADDILAGNLDGVGTDQWTAKQVEARRDRAIAEIIDEWRTKAPQVEAIVTAFPEFAARQMLMDLATHEQDVRGAAGDTGGRDCEVVRRGAGFVMERLGEQIEARGLPALLVVTDDGETVLGSGEPAATWKADTFEIMRALSGRRSPDQIRAMDWTGDPDVYLPAFTFGPFVPRPQPLAE